MELVLRREIDAGELVRTHPPVITHAHKRMAAELCGLQATGRVAISRWRAGDIAATWRATEVIAERGHYRYDAASDAVWAAVHARGFRWGVGDGN